MFYDFYCYMIFQGNSICILLRHYIAKYCDIDFDVIAITMFLAWCLCKFGILTVWTLESLTQITKWKKCQVFWLVFTIWFLHFIKVMKVIWWQDTSFQIMSLWLNCLHTKCFTLCKMNCFLGVLNTDCQTYGK